MKRFLSLVLMACAALPVSSAAEEMISATLRPGWRLADGRHVAALHLSLEPGWKTYWRAPGDAGIPPLFSFEGSGNVAQVSLDWPTPEVSWQGGMRSIVYHDEVVLPMIITPASGGDIALKGELDMGLCKDICLPHELTFAATLPAEVTRPDPMIAAAMAAVPYSEGEASVRDVRCTVEPDRDGLRFEAHIDMPSAGGREETVVEVGNPMVWVAEPTSQRHGRELVTKTVMKRVDGQAFALDRSTVRITVLGNRHAVDIIGCH